MTVRQYQNTVADLISSFTGASRWDERRGLNAEYFNAKNFQRDKRVIERADATVDFDFSASARKFSDREMLQIKLMKSVSLVV